MVGVAPAVSASVSSRGSPVATPPTPQSQQPETIPAAQQVCWTITFGVATGSAIKQELRSCSAGLQSPVTDIPHLALRVTTKADWSPRLLLLNRSGTYHRRKECRPSRYPTADAAF